MFKQWRPLTSIGLNSFQSSDRHTSTANQFFRLKHLYYIESKEGGNNFFHKKKSFFQFHWNMFKSLRAAGSLAHRASLVKYSEKWKQQSNNISKRSLVNLSNTNKSVFLISTNIYPLSFWESTVSTPRRVKLPSLPRKPLTLQRNLVIRYKKYCINYLTSPFALIRYWRSCHQGSSSCWWSW